MTPELWQKSRTLLLYSLLAMLPVLVVFLYFYQDVSSLMEDEMIASSYQTLTYIADGINRDIDQAIDLANRIDANEALRAVLEKEYENPSEYLQDYKQIVLPFLRVLPSISSGIYDFSVYTDNPTIYDSAYIRRLEPIQLSGGSLGSVAVDDNILREGGQSSAAFTEYANAYEWMRDAYSIPPEGMFVVAHGRYYPHQTGGMLFSYVKKVTTGRNQTEITSVIKIDFEVDYFSNAIASNNYKGLICVVDDNGRYIALSDSAEVWRQYVTTRGAERYIRHAALKSPMGYTLIGYTDIGYITSRLDMQRNLAVLLISVGCLVLLLVVYRLVNAVFEARFRETQIELRQKQAEFTALKNQVDPHFLFNLLETVRMKLFLAGAKEHSVVIMRMARLYRKLLLQSADVIPLDSELDFISEFLEIQKYRYDEALVFTPVKHVNDGDFLVPKMLLQTFIENACKHGLNESGESVLDIDIEVKGGKLHFLLKDNGPGFDADVLEQIENMRRGGVPQSVAGVGIANALQRMRLYYGDSFSFTINSQKGKGAVIAVVLPGLQR